MKKPQRISGHSFVSFIATTLLLSQAITPGVFAGDDLGDSLDDKLCETSFAIQSEKTESETNTPPTPRRLPVVKNIVRHASGHRHLTDSIDQIRGHYDYLVIGSGYGASVAALRVTEALNQSMAASGDIQDRLAVFERGREWLPGDFPSDLVELTGAVRTPVNKLGLVNTNTALGADMDVVGANGLGGTSLLNAAITARPPENVWSLPRWPHEVQADFENGVLEEDFKRAESMLLPNTSAQTPSLPKTQMHIQGMRPGVPTGELTLNINHQEGRENHGVCQKACTHCGNCCGGCNVGAKNTLTTNYLPAAKDLGAKIFTQIEVKNIERLPPGSRARYLVNYVAYRKNRLGVIESTRGAVTANNVFLGAGSAGTTEILLRSEKSGMPMSEKLGHGVSANGDVLGFVYNSRVKSNIAGFPDSYNKLHNEKPRVGQTIAVYGDYRAYNRDQPIERQFLMLDGAIPGSMASAVSKAIGSVMGASAYSSLSGSIRVTKDMLAPLDVPNSGAINHSMLLLACGHDSCGGKYILDNDDNAHVIWPNARDEDNYRYINDEMRLYAERLGGQFIPNPRASWFGGGKTQATHPLGGAVMGNDVHSGVVNHQGQVFDPHGGVYEGLYVLDAASLPHSLAAPPLITITTLAERSMRGFVAREFYGSLGSKK